MFLPFTVEQLEALRIKAAEQSLHFFVRLMWPVVEPKRKMIDGWALRAICRHLEAVAHGDITRLVVNVPPGSMKSLMSNVFFPAWIWGPRNNPQARFLAISYTSSLTERDNERLRTLVSSDEYKNRWGNRFTPGDSKIKLTTNKTGWKLASSVEGVGTGERADYILLDDPNNIQDSDSKTARDRVQRWVNEVMPTRLNDPDRSAIILIQQRTHQEDATGILLDPERGGDDWCYLMIPMEFDPGWMCGATTIGWIDPRIAQAAEDAEKGRHAARMRGASDADVAAAGDAAGRGQLFWPERFSAEVVAGWKLRLGDYAFAGQMQQHPEPRGGAIIKRDWWKLYGKADEDPVAVKMRFPAMSFLLAHLDCALTDKEENDPSALVVMGVWEVPQTGQMAVMMVNAWQDRLQINPLVKRVAATCDKYHIDTLIIENKANGHSVHQEILRNYQRAEWSTILVDPTPYGGKVARAHSVTHLFEEGLVWHPNTEWAQMVIDQCMPAGTQVFTADGLRSIEDIRPGEEVLTHNGRFRMVVATANHEADSVVTLYGKSLDPLTLTGNHLVWSPSIHYDEARARLPSACRWVPAADVLPRRYRDVVRNAKTVSEPTQATHDAVVLPTIKREEPIDEIDLREFALPGGPNKTIQMVEDGEFFAGNGSQSNVIRWRQTLDWDFGRIIGLYVAEGSGNYDQVSWSVNALKEQHLVTEIRRFVSERLGCGTHTHTANNAVTVTANLGLIRKFFWGFGKRAPNKCLPRWVWEAPEQFLSGLLDGYVEGDGWRNGDQIVCTTVSRTLAWQVRMLAQRLGFSALCHQTKDAAEVEIMGRVCQTLPKYTISWRTERHYPCASVEIEKGLAYSVMKSEKKTGSIVVYNLAVIDDESYVTTGGTVHNCAIFPKGSHDDLVDGVTGCLRYLREHGILYRRQEKRWQDEDIASLARSQVASRPLYPG